jgi:hypothetical protein
MFSLVVDDFGVQYSKTEDVEHLAATLRSLYITMDWTGSKYLGLTIKHDKDEEINDGVQSLFSDFSKEVEKITEQFLIDSDKQSQLYNHYETNSFKNELDQHLKNESQNSK